MQRAEVRVGDEIAGSIEVFYSDKEPDQHEIPSLQKKRHLLDSIARDIGLFLQSKEAQQELETQFRRISATMDSIPEAIYVADPDTYEILFVNRAFAEELGRDVLGRTCHREFYGIDSPCAFCTNDIIRKQKNTPHTWDYHNPVTGKYYQISDVLIDWPDGREVRFQLATDLTERKLAERRLIREKLFTETALGSLPGVFFLLDKDGKLIRWNNNFGRISGYEPEEINGKTILESTGDDERELVADWIAEVFRNGKGTIQSEFISKQGKRIPYLFSATRVDEEGVSYLAGVGIDISEQKKLRRRLEASESKFENLVKVVPLPLCNVNSKGEIVYFNDRFRESYGYSHEDIPTLDDWWQVAFPDETYRKWVVKTWNDAIDKAAAENGYFEPIEYKVTCKDGAVRLVEIGGIALDDGFLATLFDVTERRQANAALAESEEHLSRALLAQHAGTWVWDIKTGEVIWDDRMQIIFGLEPGSFGGTYEDWRNLVHPDDLVAEDAATASALMGGPQYDVVYRVAGPDGSWRHVRSQGITIRDDDDQPSKMLGICLDVTDKVIAEQVLEKVLKDLKNSNLELEQFAYVASHDLQEPLRMIGSYLQLLERRYSDILDGDAQEFMDFAVDGANRLSRMINDLLTFSRLGTHGQKMHPTDCNLVLEQALLQLGTTIEERQARINCQQLPTLMADATQLTQLFQNLIGNAIKFCEADTPQIGIAAEERGDCWQFAVSDNGIGIEPQNLERIFVIFQRLHGRERFGGTGIGLALCKKIIERHNGKIWVESQPGEGTTCYFTIPKVNPPSQGTDKEESDNDERQTRLAN